MKGHSRPTSKRRAYKWWNINFNWNNVITEYSDSRISIILYKWTIIFYYNILIYMTIILYNLPIYYSRSRYLNCKRRHVVQKHRVTVPYKAWRSSNITLSDTVGSLLCILPVTLSRLYNYKHHLHVLFVDIISEFQFFGMKQFWFRIFIGSEKNLTQS